MGYADFRCLAEVATTAGLASSFFSVVAGVEVAPAAAGFVPNSGVDAEVVVVLDSAGLAPNRGAAAGLSSVGLVAVSADFAAPKSGLAVPSAGLAELSAGFVDAVVPNENAGLAASSGFLAAAPKRPPEAGVVAEWWQEWRWHQTNHQQACLFRLLRSTKKTTGRWSS